jgi:hypothetical protein
MCLSKVSEQGGACSLPYPQQMWQTARVPAFRPLDPPHALACLKGDRAVDGDLFGPKDL